MERQRLLSGTSRNDLVIAEDKAQRSRSSSTPARLEAVGLRMAARLALLESNDGSADDPSEDEEEVDEGSSVLPRTWRHAVKPDGLRLWRKAAMAPNVWASLPLPVLDVLFRKGLTLHDLRSVGLTCKRWHAAVFQKVPYSKTVFVDNARAWERKRQREREAMQAERRRRHWQAFRRFAFFLFASIPTVLFLLVGLAGLLYFPGLVRSVSTSPACPQAFSMTTALYSCCSFWILDALLYGIWSFLVHGPFSHDNCGCRPISAQRSFRFLNWIGIASTLGIWSSAAACIHFCNACMDVNPLVAWSVRAFAATSLTFGLLVSAFGIFLQCVIVLRN